jgi:hypothetical protein
MARGDPAVPLYPVPENVRPVYAVRGTIVFLDWCWLRANRTYDRYTAAIEAGTRARLLGVAASDWVPAEILEAHYCALDSMGFTRAQAMTCGVSVGQAVHGSMLRTLVRLAGGLGATPWAALGQGRKLWDRSWRGGAFVPYRLGEKSARVEVLETAMARSAFHRASFCGALSVGIGWLCQEHVVREIENARRDDSFVFRIDWV